MPCATSSIVSHDPARARIAGDRGWACVAARQAAEKRLGAVPLHAGLRAETTHNLPGHFDALVAAGVATRKARARLNRARAALVVAFGFSRHPWPGLGVAPGDIVTPEPAAEAMAQAEAVVVDARTTAAGLDA